MPSTHSIITLREITRDTVRQILDLRVARINEANSAATWRINTCRQMPRQM